MAKSSTSFTSAHWTPERRAALAKRNHEQVYTPELCAAMVREVHHSAETRAKMSNTRNSAKYRKKISLIGKQHAKKNLPECMCIAHSGQMVSRTRTHIENILVNVLLTDFPEVIREKPFGRYRVDAYLPPPYHVAFEADGSYWHTVRENKRPGYYSMRDKYLMDEFGLPVVRIPERELREMVR